MINTEHDHRDL